MTSFKNVVFLKSYAQVNLGDDLFMDILFSRYPDTLFYLECDSDKYKKIFVKHTNVQYIQERSNLTIRTILFIIRKLSNKLFKNIVLTRYKKQYGNYLKQSDAFVSLGGSIFMQGRKAMEDKNLLFYQTVINILQRKPIFFLGCNFGPYWEKEYKEEYEKIFSQACDVCFREKFSYELFKGNINVKLKPDIVFGYNKLFNVDKIERSIGFSIVNVNKLDGNINEDIYVNKYVDVVNSFIDKGYIIKFFSFCKEEGDENIIEKIYNRLKSKHNIFKVNYGGDIEHFLKEYYSVESVFCGRFHALVLSMVFNQKILPMAYSKKMTNILEDIDYKGEIIEMRDFVNYSLDKFEKALNHDYNIEYNIKNAYSHFQVLDNYIARTTTSNL